MMLIVVGFVAQVLGLAVALRFVRRPRRGQLPRPGRVPREFLTGEWEQSP